jgi:hypothetical protein
MIYSGGVHLYLAGEGGEGEEGDMRTEGRVHVLAAKGSGPLSFAALGKEQF